MLTKKIFSILLDIGIIGIVLFWGYLLYKDFNQLQMNHESMKYTIFNVKILLFSLFIIVSSTTLFYLNFLGGHETTKTGISEKLSPIDEKKYQELSKGISDIKNILNLKPDNGNINKPQDVKSGKETQETGLLVDDIELLNKIFVSNNLQELTKTLINTIKISVNSHRISVFLYNSKKNKLVMVTNIGFSDKTLKSIEIDKGISWDVFKKGKRLFVTNIETHPEIASMNHPQYRKKSFMLFPIHLFKNETTGVINITEKETDQGIFSVQDLEKTQFLISLFTLKLESLILLDSTKELLSKRNV